MLREYDRSRGKRRIALIRQDLFHAADNLDAIALGPPYVTWSFITMTV